MGFGKRSESGGEGREGGSRGIALRWIALVAISVPSTLLLRAVDIPAALLLGPMITAIALSASGAKLKLPPVPFALAQAIVGCLIARNIPASIFAEVGKDWLVFALGVTLVIAAAVSLGWLLAWRRVLPGTTAVWGSAPGAAAVMTLMSESGGADMRLVAFMQYSRVLCVAFVASLISRAFVTSGGAAPPQAPPLFAPVSPLALERTIALAAFGAFAGMRFKIPAGALVVPLFAGIALQDTNLMTIVLPQWLLALCYALLGWGIGLRFTREIVAYAAKALPRVLGSIALLIAICGAFAFVLVRTARLDPLTAYLATSPGGADSVAIIAASSHVDVPFVMTMQVLRFLTVMIVGPPLTRLVARSVARLAPLTPAG